MTDGTSALWSYLATAPLTRLTVTLLAYHGAAAVSRALRQAPIVNPVLLAVCVIAPILWLTCAGYERDFEGAQFIHFLLGPATFALAAPVHDDLGTIRRLGLV
jgi:putative effector of murein hydrolase